MKLSIKINKKSLKEIPNFLKKEFQKRKKTKAILGFSGGLDSALSALLCKKAGLDLYLVILPHHERNLLETKKAAQFLNLSKNRIIIIDIAPIVDVQVKELQKWLKLDKVDKGNIMARQRMIILYALARRLNGLVIGTGNLSEYYLGYFTLHGDSACDINPIAGLWKTQIFALAKCLGIPLGILKKKPSAELWPGQTDEGELGFSYWEADPILYLSIIKKIPKERIIKKYGLNKDLVEKVFKRVKMTEYKRQGPAKFKS